MILHLDTNKYKVYVTYTDKNTFKILEERIGNYCEYIEIDEKIEVDVLIFCSYILEQAKEEINISKTKDLTMIIISRLVKEKGFARVKKC